MHPYKLSQIALLLGQTLHIDPDPVIDILLTDSRSLVFPERSLFFAIVTRKGDGHDYIGELYCRGVRAFVVSHHFDATAYSGATFLEVDDALQALQLIATKHRESLEIPVVAITGSNGKTTLKEILYQLLRFRMRVGRSPKSYNSAIGVPLSLWSIQPDHNIALIEAGISMPDEMDVLERMIRPSIGIITNIGEAHQENFESLDQKCKEKLRLFRGCETIICCLDDEIITHCLEETAMIHKVIGWSRKDSSAQVFVKEEVRTATGTDLTVIIMGRTITNHIPYTDDGSIHDVLLAMTALLKVQPSLLWEEMLFETLEPISMRLEVLEGADNSIVINDTYNSDYESLRIALDFLVRRNTDDRPMALVLSDIHESGTLPADLYKRVAKLIARYPLDKLYLIGEDLSRCRSLFEAVTGVFKSTEDFLSGDFREELRGHIILLKGSRVARFERIEHALEKRTHQTILDVNLSHITHNLNYFRSLLPSGTKVVCMVKAFGYGAGSYEIAKTLTDARCDYLAVAVTDEGIELREKGIHMPIIVMNPERSTFSHMIEYRLQPEIYSFIQLREFIIAADMQGEVGYPIHLKWDTGMHRMGFDPEEDSFQLYDTLGRTEAVRVASIFTHLAVADESGEDLFTLHQLKQIREVRDGMRIRYPYPFLTHALNTAGILRFPKYAMDMVRLGIGLYGIPPFKGGGSGLRPVARLRTRVLQVRDLPAGDTVGYGRRGMVSRPSKIAVIPIGYADGLSRQLGNGAISFRTESGKLVPTIGNICMDTLMLDVTDDPEVFDGSEIVIFDEALPIERLAEACHTIPYEILANLSPRIARHYYTE